MSLDRAAARELLRKGLWTQNPGLAQILGLCPILAVSTSAVNATMLALATILVMMLSNVAVAGLRRWIPHEIRIPVFILLIAALVTIVDLLFNAFFHELYVILGIFIPLITTNCIVLARVEAFAAKNSVAHSTLDGLAMGLGLLWVLALLGAMREFLSGGTLLAGIEMVIPGAQALQILPETYPDFLLAALPPGAFILLGCMIAGKNGWDARAARRAKKTAPVPKTIEVSTGA